MIHHEVELNSINLYTNPIFYPKVLIPPINLFQRNPKACDPI